MRCLSKPIVLFATCLALAAVGLQQTEARAFRNDAVRNDKRIHPPVADHVLMRERYHALRYHGVHAEAPSAAVETIPEAPAPALAQASLYQSVVRSVASAIRRIFGSRLPDSDKLAQIDTATLDEVRPHIQTPAPLVPAQRGGRGKLCVAGMCGLNLFFASLWVTFAACFVVVYLMDKQLNQRSSRSSELAKDTKKTDAEPVTQQPAVAKKQTAGCHARPKRSMSTLRARMFNYYQDVSEMSSSMLRQRPPLGL